MWTDAKIRLFVYAGVSKKTLKSESVLATLSNVVFRPQNEVAGPEFARHFMSLNFQE